MKKKNGFTLIELIAVLVILAILALIVTPLVMNIIRKARISADKRSIDAYGRSVELAIANYLLDTGDFPSDISQLTIEYSGDEVVCSTVQLNSNSTIYLAGCTVGGRRVDYIYGKEETVTYDVYSVGDEVNYNNVDYYVIKDSSASEETVTLLKAEPITSTEIIPYLSSTEVASKVNTSGTYATMAYYSAEDCVSAGDVSGCSTDYKSSDIKQVVDIWKANYASGATEARLITVNDIINIVELEKIETPRLHYKIPDVAVWLYSNSYRYLTMSQYGDSDSGVCSVRENGVVYSDDNYYMVQVYYTGYTVRPVITTSKTVLENS